MKIQSDNDTINKSIILLMQVFYISLLEFGYIQSIIPS